jgi:AcrR family transcriptional regulator
VATRQRLLDAAEREFAQRGFAGARLRDIADAAAVQPALIHHYFTDKLGLYNDVLDRALGQASEASWRLLGERRDVEGLIAGFVDVLVDFFSAHGNLLAILRHESVSGASGTIALLRERTGPVLDAVRVFLAERQRAGEVRDDVDVDEILLAGLSVIAHPFTEGPFLEALLPGTLPGDAAAIERRKRATAALLLRAIEPRR